MMRRVASLVQIRGLAWVVIGLMGICLALGLANPSVAITACGGVLRDGDDLIPAEREASVGVATNATQLAGAQPLIVLMRTSGGRHIDTDLQEAITTCPALAEDPGAVIAIGIATDDQTVVIQPGASVADRLHSADISKAMREQIGRIPIEQVLVNGVGEINQQLYDTRNTQPAQPVFTSTAWVVLGVLVLLTGGVGAFWVVQNRRTLRAAKTNAEAIRERGMALALDLERDQRALEKQTRDLAEWMALCEIEPLSRAHVEVNLRAHAVLRQWHGITNQMGTAEGFSAEAYAQFTTRLDTAYAQLQSVADQMMRTQGNLAQVNSVIDTLDGRLAAMPTQCAAAQAAINAAQQNGWKTDRCAADLALAQTYVEWAQQARDRQELLGADELLRVAEAKIAASTTQAHNLERTHADLNQQVIALLNRHDDLVQALGPARDAMGVLKESFASRSWESVVGNGSNAQALLAGIPDTIKSVQVLLERDVQDVEGARVTLESVVNTLDRAEGLIDAIHETLADLQHAAKLLPDAVRAADRAVETAVQVAQSRQNDAGIDQLTLMRDRIHREHQQAQPDLQALINVAELLTLQAEQWVAERQGDQAVDAAIERAARSGVDQARLRCTQAARLVMTHRSELPDSYVQIIEELDEGLDAVVAESNPALRLDKATKIRHQATAITHEAKRVMRTQSQVMPSQNSNSRW